MSDDAHDDGTYFLLSDEPSVADPDALGFDQLCDEIAALVRASRRSTPLVIGIEGDWGSGKSSLMKRLQRTLEPPGTEHPRRPDDITDPPDVHTVWFNAWTAKSTDTMEGLVKTVLDKLDTNYLRRALRNQRLISWLRVLALIIAGVFRLDRVVDDVWSRVSDDPKARNELHALVSGAMNTWSLKNGSASPQRLIVVFIDDLDRCEASQVLAVFGAMKLYLNAVGFVFVLGYDRTAITDAVREERQDADLLRALLYMEKIVQVTYELPHPDAQRCEDLVQSYLRDSHTADLFEAATKALVIERNNANPRRIKRFINHFVVAHKLEKGWPAQDLVTALLLRLHFPDFARLFRDYDPARDFDPLDKFSVYRHVRSTVDGAAPLTEHHVDVLRSLELEGEAPTPARVGEPATETLVSWVDDRVPESFAVLVHDRNFVDLVHPYDDDERRGDFAQRMQRGATPGSLLNSVGAPVMEDTPAAESPVLGPEGTDKPLTGARLLWVDDRPENNVRELGSLRRLGADVVTVRSRWEAEQALHATSGFDVILSDVGRGSHTREGLTALEAWREQETWSGPVVFYTTGLTPSLRRKLESLDAYVTTRPADLLSAVVMAVRRSTPGDSDFKEDRKADREASAGA